MHFVKIQDGPAFFAHVRCVRGKIHYLCRLLRNALSGAIVSPPLEEEGNGKRYGNIEISTNLRKYESSCNYGIDQRP